MSFNIEAGLGKYITKPTPIDKPELILVYGQPGSGKTFFAGGALDVPGFKKGLYVDVEGSSVGVIKDPRWDIIRLDKYPDANRMKELAKARGVDVGDLDVKAERFQFLKTILGKGPQGLFNPANEHSYDVIVVDTFDVAQDWAVDYLVDGAGATVTRGGEINTQVGWANVRDWSTDLAYDQKQSTALGILVVHDREEKSNTGAVQKKIRATGGAKDILPGIPDVVVYLERRAEGDDYVTYGYFGTDDGKVTKNRFDFPPVVKDVTIPKLYKFIDSKSKGDKK